MTSTPSPGQSRLRCHRSRRPGLGRAGIAGLRSRGGQSRRRSDRWLHGQPAAAARRRRRRSCFARTHRHVDRDYEAPVGRRRGPGGWHQVFERHVSTTRSWASSMARVTWWAVPERFALVLDNVYGQIATDPFSPIGPENRQNTNFLSTGPDWYIPLGERTRAYLGGRYGVGAVRRSTDNDSERLLGIVGIDRAVSSYVATGGAGQHRVGGFRLGAADGLRPERGVCPLRVLPRAQLPELTVNAGYTWLTSDAGRSFGALARGAAVPAGVVQRRRAAGTGQSILGCRRRVRRRRIAGFRRRHRPGSHPRRRCLRGTQWSRDHRFPAISGRRSASRSACADELYETATLDRRRYDAQVTGRASHDTAHDRVGGRPLVAE